MLRIPTAVCFRFFLLHNSSSSSRWINTKEHTKKNVKNCGSDKERECVYHNDNNNSISNSGTTHTTVISDCSERESNVCLKRARRRDCLSFFAAALGCRVAAGSGVADTLFSLLSTLLLSCHLCLRKQVEQNFYVSSASNNNKKA